MVATAGDYIWYTYGVEHRMIAGTTHGIVLLTSCGLALGGLRGRVLQGLPLGVLAGLGGALSYDLLVAIMDRRVRTTSEEVGLLQGPAHMRPAFRRLRQGLSSRG